MGQTRISALAPWLGCIAAHLSTLGGVRCIAEIPSMGCAEREETNGSVILQGGKAWNLPELSPVTLDSLNSTKDE